MGGMDSNSEATESRRLEWQVLEPQGCMGSWRAPKGLRTESVFRENFEKYKIWKGESAIF